MRSLMVFVSALCCFSAASAFSAGRRPEKLDPVHVPSSACLNMIPAHNDSAPSSDPAPYMLAVSATQASPGGVIEVLASGMDGAQFKGLYMQARVVGGGTSAVGEFPVENESRNPAVKKSTCPPGENNAISYVSRTGLDSIALDWKVPENIPAEGYAIYFRATFLESFARFWINVDSPPIMVMA